MAYKGELNVEDNDFRLSFEILILRSSNEVAFTLLGYDHDGESKIHGQATKSEGGFFKASGLTITYKNHPDRDEASIEFTLKEEIVEDNNKCNVKGTYTQYGDSWNFDGILDEFVP